MAEMVRNDSSSVISSLQMDYGDSDEDENNSSKNLSRNEEEKVTESKDTLGGEDEKRTESRDPSGSNEERETRSDLSQGAASTTTDHVAGLSSQEPLSQTQINIARVNIGDLSDKEAEGTPTDFISDDEDSDHPHQHHHHHSHHHHASEPKTSSLATEPINTESPSSLPSANAARKAMRLVSYGPDEDVDDDEDGDSEQEEEAEAQESNDNSPEAQTTDTAALSRSVQNMASDDIKIPPEPPGNCSFQLQRKIEDMYDRMRKEGLDLNRVIQSKKNFRNPSIYEKLIEFCHIDEKGTNFPPEIYDPHLWGKESFFDELDKVQRKDMERREKEKREKTKIEFVTGTKKASSMSDISGMPDEKKRKTKWDAQPGGVSAGVVKAPGVQGPGVVNLTATATGTKATVISAVGSLSKKPTGK
ncbi:SAP30-binding protein [Aplysia californica]|uniref:SAP30-binding protein n=1 Tax=Aplysia californica TaxID=6500 RepID=A0ABM0JP28_APLCA|nr:SAP30-binding protein [Aplysia californica]